MPQNPNSLPHIQQYIIRFPTQNYTNQLIAISHTIFRLLLTLNTHNNIPDNMAM